MGYNVLFAIKNLVENCNLNVEELASTSNRMNNMGEGLEMFIKEIFSGTLNTEDRDKKKEKWEEVFSWQGSKNAPPDLMIKEGDAVEVKKVESLSTDIQLNSSSPKKTLLSADSKVTEKCRGCEEWEEKDNIYAVGYIPKKSNKLKSLCFVYGTEYAAKDDVYDEIKTILSDAFSKIKNLEFSETKELGRVNKVDPLSISNLRIRGMWTIKNPYNTFEDIYKIPTDSIFDFMAIISEEKYNSFPEEDRKQFKALVDDKNNNLKMIDKGIKDPDDINKTRKVKLITFTLNEEEISNG